MKYIPNSVSRAVSRQILIGKKHSPTILFGAGVAGVIGTTILASRATLRIGEVLDETQKNLQLAKDLEDERYSDEDRQRDIAVIYVNGAIQVARLYAPAVVLGVASIASLAGSHRILTNRNATLTAAYVALNQAFDEYRARVSDEFGEEKEREIHFAHAQRPVTIDEDGQPREIMVRDTSKPGEPSIYARFFDELCGSWNPEPEYNLAFLKAQETYLTNKLQARGHLFLNEVYEELGIPHSRAGAVVGWIIDKGNDNYVDFGLFNGENPKARDFVNGREPSILLDFNVDGVIYDKI